jgi:hypothetical protein
MGKKTIHSLRKSLKRSSEDVDQNEDEKIDQQNEEVVITNESNDEKQGNEIEEEKNENTKRKRVRKRKASNVDANQENEHEEQESKVTKIQSNDESRWVTLRENEITRFHLDLQIIAQYILRVSHLMPQKVRLQRFLHRLDELLQFDCHDGMTLED